MKSQVRQLLSHDWIILKIAYSAFPPVCDLQLCNNFASQRVDTDWEGLFEELNFRFTTTFQHIFVLSKFVRCLLHDFILPFFEFGIGENRIAAFLNEVHQVGKLKKGLATAVALALDSEEFFSLGLLGSILKIQCDSDAWTCLVSELRFADVGPDFSNIAHL